MSIENNRALRVFAATATDLPVEVLAQGLETMHRIMTAGGFGAVVVCFMYKNPQGQVKLRRIIPSVLEFAEKPDEPKTMQWLLSGEDPDRGGRRTYALKDIVEWGGYDSAAKVTT